MTGGTHIVARGRPSGAAYGNLIDLTRLQRGAEAEICDHCHTINLGNARHCKACTHRLPAFGHDQRALAKLAKAGPPPRQRSGLDLFAFCVVINALVFFTTSVPLR